MSNPSNPVVEEDELEPKGSESKAAKDELLLPPLDDVDCGSCESKSRKFTSVSTDEPIGGLGVRVLDTIFCVR